MGEGLPPHKICPSGTFASSRPPPCPWGGSQKALEEAVWVGRARGGVWAPEASHPLGRRAFREPLRTGAQCGYHFAAAPKSVAAPKSATALLGFASSALQMPIFFDSETQLFPDPATVAEKAALRGLRTAPGAVTSMHINHW